jgi:hypothetical protein
MCLTHGVRIVTQRDFISEVQISESGYKHPPAIILSLRAGIWDDRNNTSPTATPETAVVASRVSFSIICDDQECPARMWYQHSVTLRSCWVQTQCVLCPYA